MALVPAAPALAAPGDLDPAFSADGLAPTSGIAGPVGIAPSAAGGVFVAGLTDLAGGPFIVEHILGDGSTDAGFGQDGRVEFSVGPVSVLRSISTDEQGRILLAGLTSGPTHDGFVARLNADGSPDLTFGTNGLVMSPGGISLAYDAETDALGRVLVAGNAQGQLAVARLLANGAPDTSFGSDGSSSIDDDFAVAEGVLGIGADAIYAGSSGVARVNESGEFDETFGKDGLFGSPFGPEIGFSSIVPLANGSVAVTLAGCVRFGHAGCTSRGLLLSSAGIIEADKDLGSGPRLEIISDALFGASTAQADDLPPTGALTALTPALARDKGFGFKGQSSVFLGVEATVSLDLTAAPDGGAYLALSDGRRGWIAHLLGGGTSHDRDADGVDDASDRCPWGSAAVPSGCPDTRVRVSTNTRGIRLHVVVRSAAGSCVDGAKVRVLEQTRHGSRSVASKIASGFGRDFIRFRVAPGRYTVKVGARGTTLSRCLAGVSNVRVDR